MKKWTALVMLGIAATLAGCSSNDGPSGTCVDGSAALETWMTDHSGGSVGNLSSLYYVKDIHATCGDVVVETGLGEDGVDADVAKDACFVLAKAVGDAPDVESITVRYATGNDACTKRG